MELELVNSLWECLKEYFDAKFGLMLFFGTELFKKMLLEKEDGKYHFIFDKDKILRFNIRWLILFISLTSGTFIVLFSDDTKILFSLVATLCITIAFYDFIIETIKKKIGK